MPLKSAEIDGMKIYGESKNKTSVISFNIESIHPYDIGSLIDNLDSCQDWTSLYNQ